ncbi:MAG: TonB-dependent receptor [Dysgonamonadaceae bacterium]|jgi:outer membrane receptor for ferrienterochelin and colicins|nr:TonB-dependent receptor [Dysgonamonadaceae bacterium]
MRRINLLLMGVVMSLSTFAQEKTDTNIFGDVKSKGEHLPFVTVKVVGTDIGTSTDESGHYMLTNLPEGKVEIEVHSIGYNKEKKTVYLLKGKTIELNFDIEESSLSLDEVVVTGTKTAKRKTDSPVIVGVIDGGVLGRIQANTLSEGLCFSTGLRVETDCQTCNYSQLRMNGLGGSYSQILINSRPVFSSVMGLYGMDQIPANMIDRIEVVRGGGSALYGSSAIGGTVNIITKIPFNNSYEASVNHAVIAGQTNDNQISVNTNIVSKQRNAGIAFFANRRERGYYDANGDNFSEFPRIKANTFGLTSFLKPSENQKIAFNLNSIYEYRYGGEMTEKAAHIALQSEERLHNVLTGGLDYKLDFNDNKSAFITYVSAQNTKRKHYTGIVPDETDTEAYKNHFLNPPYGTTNNTSLQGGVQINHRLENFLSGINVLTAGAEYLYDDILDEIPAYSYITDQTTKNMGLFLQSDWDVFKNFNLLLGARADKHSMVHKIIINPRVSALYKWGKNTQFRASWSTGFRAPQAFDTDMHIAFAGGGVSRIRLAEDLEAERSNSYSASVNYDKAAQKYIWGFTFEGFYTHLSKAFALEQVGSDNFGDIFEKINSTGSVVQGLTLELRGNYDGKIQLETGFTLQQSKYDNPIANSENLEARKKYLKTPNQYGYYTLTFSPNKKFNASISGVYTGSMLIMHAGGAPENPKDRYVDTRSFFDNNIKLSYLFKMEKLNTGLEIFGGVKNIFNAYQSDFDSEKNRDSSYMYGPALPRSIFFGVKIKSL